MDIGGVNLSGLAAAFQAFGPWGFVAVLLWAAFRTLAANNETHRKDQADLIESHRREMSDVLETYRKDVAELKKFYENNVLLVERCEELTTNFQDLTKSIREVVMMNTQAITGLSKSIETNQFCPEVRLQKQAPGRVTGG